MHQNTVLWQHEEECTVCKLLLLPRKEILQERWQWSFMATMLFASSSKAALMPGLERTGISGTALSHSLGGDTESQLLTCTSGWDLKQLTTLISCLQNDPQSSWAPWSVCLAIPPHGYSAHQDRRVGCVSLSLGPVCCRMDPSPGYTTWENMSAKCKQWTLPLIPFHLLFLDPHHERREQMLLYSGHWSC